jgi:hypothetical protein
METTSYFRDGLGFLFAAIGMVAMVTVGTLGAMRPTVFSQPKALPWIYGILIFNCNLATLDGLVILWKLLTEASEIRHLSVWGTCVGIHFVAAVLIAALLQHLDKEFRGLGTPRTNL